MQSSSFYEDELYDVVESNRSLIDSWNPRFREYTEFESRMNSFVNWPRGVSQSVEELAQAGFFYKGKHWPGPELNGTFICLFLQLCNFE